MADLKDKVVLITGAGKGSGRLLAVALAAYGAVIAANDISPVNLDPVVEEIHSRGGRARAYVEDVAKKVGVQSILKQVEDDLGRLDVLINHAAVEPRVPLLEIDEWDWHRVLDVNLTGAFLMIQSAGRIMRAGGSGVIINLVAPSREGTGAGFSASMRALEGLSHRAAQELGPYGIRVHAVESTGEQTVERVLALLAIQEEKP